MGDTNSPGDFVYYKIYEYSIYTLFMIFILVQLGVIILTITDTFFIKSLLLLNTYTVIFLYLFTYIQ